MDSVSIAALATAVLSVVSVFFGVKYRKWLEKARLFAGLIGEIVAALEDDKVSEEELKQIVAKAKQVAAEVEG